MKNYTFTVKMVIEAESEKIATFMVLDILSNYEMQEMADGMLVDWDHVNPYNPCLEEEV